MGHLLYNCTFSSEQLCESRQVTLLLCPEGSIQMSRGTLFSAHILGSVRIHPLLTQLMIKGTCVSLDLSLLTYETETTVTVANL